MWGSATAELVLPRGVERTSMQHTAQFVFRADGKLLAAALDGLALSIART